MDGASLRADTRLFLAYGKDSSRDAGLGPGVVELCERVSELGSLNKAARDMGMAYSKAWRIVKETEEVLGIQLFERRGAQGSTLTEGARSLVTLFRQAESAAQRAADEALAEGISRLEGTSVFGDGSAPVIETHATPDLIAGVRQAFL